MIRAGTTRTVYAFSHSVLSGYLVYSLPRIFYATNVDHSVHNITNIIFYNLNFYNINISRTGVNSTVDNIHVQ